MAELFAIHFMFRFWYQLFHNLNQKHVADQRWKVESREVKASVEEDGQFPSRYHRKSTIKQKRMNGFKDNVWKEMDKIEVI